MRSPYTSIFFMGMLFFAMALLRCTTTTKAPFKTRTKEPKSYSLRIERGAFHYDSFLLQGDTLRYLPEENANHQEARYNIPTRHILDSMVAKRFFNKVEQDGFWELLPIYSSTTSCTSRLRITLETSERIKTVTCDDFDRDCPDLIKYIEEKIVDLEGNDLVRVYLPG